MIFVPFEKTSASIRTPWRVYSLVAVNLIVFLSTSHKIAEFAGEYGFVSANGAMLTVFTSMFLHTSVMHLFGNMLFLLMFGDNIEDVLGPTLFLLVYLASGLGAAFAHYAMEPGSAVPAIGASGAISGVMGVYVIFFPRVKINLMIAPIFLRTETVALVGIGLWLAEQLVLAIFFESAGMTEQVGVAFWAHIGGLMTGVFLGSYLVFLDVKERYERKLEDLKEAQSRIELDLGL